jgi:hypothetical protein
VRVGSINPLVNPRINPHLNPNHDGLLFFDLDNHATGFSVNGLNRVLILFNNNLTHIGTAVPVNDGYILFNSDNEWTGHLVNNGSNGYAQFDRDNRWIGFVH